jgi:hypothetical protein
MQAQLHILEAIRVRIPYGSFPTCAGPETDITNPLVVARRNKVIAGIDPVLVDAFGCVDLFGIQPQDLTHVLRAHETGCGDMDVEAALADGRIRRFQVGAPVVAPAQEPLPTANPAPAAADPTLSTQPTAIPLKPTAVSVPPPEPLVQPAQASGLSGGNGASTEQIISLKPLLNLALVPAAAVVTGVGLVVLTRMRRSLPGKNAKDGTHPEGTESGNLDQGHD